LGISMMGVLLFRGKGRRVQFWHRIGIGILSEFLVPCPTPHLTNWVQKDKLRISSV